jgi:acyl carrier protein
MNKEDIIDIIYLAIDDYNQINLNNMITKTPNTLLYGQEGKLDSLGLVNLILAVEEKLLDKYNKNISLADDKAFSEKKSPFSNISILAEFICNKIDDK